jgi:hypothetical protein
MLLFVLLSHQSLLAAVTAADFLEVVAVSPKRVINHEVELKGSFDDETIETLLTGPKLFSQSVGIGTERKQGQMAYLNWYKIAKPTDEPLRVLSVRDELTGKGIHQITIEESEYLLSPAQRIATGPPSQIPDKLNHFKAYRVGNATQVSKKLKLSGAFGGANRTVVKAAFFCLPVEEWHHHERFPIKDSSRCMLVYELLPQQVDVSITTLDQFGLNTLAGGSSGWLCVPAEIVKGTSPDRAR